MLPADDAGKAGLDRLFMWAFEATTVELASLVGMGVEYADDDTTPEAMLHSYATDALALLRSSLAEILGPYAAA